MEETLDSTNVLVITAPDLIGGVLGIFSGFGHIPREIDKGCYESNTSKR